MGDLPFHPDLSLKTLDLQDYEAVRCFFRQIVSDGLEANFHPHPFTSETARNVCTQPGMNWYAGALLRLSATPLMIGYVMLRGWNDGYLVPSFGMCVLPEYQCKGIGRLLLQYAIVVAKLRNSPAIRLKVYPHNHGAVELYRSFGFEYAGDLENGQLVGHLTLPVRLEFQDSGFSER